MNAVETTPVLAQGPLLLGLSPSVTVTNLATVTVMGTVGPLGGWNRLLPARCVRERSWGLRSFEAHDHEIEPPGPHNGGARHLWRRGHHHRRHVACHIDPGLPPQPPCLVGRLRLPGLRRVGPVALQEAGVRRAPKPYRPQVWEELRCHRGSRPRRCCECPTCSTASVSAGERCVDGEPMARSPKPCGWARTPSAGPAVLSTSGSPTGPLPHDLPPHDPGGAREG